MKKITYLLVKFLILFFKILPFKILYIFSDIFRLILQYVIRYRRKVIKKNLKSCFPELNKIEINKIITDNYKNLADIILEGIKGLSLSKQELSERYIFTNKELIQNFLDKNKTVIITPAHISNWEWGVLSFGFNFINRSIGIYKTINNPYIENYIRALRAVSTIQLISTKETRQVAVEIPKGKLLILMGDQNPSNIRDAIWVRFFGIETACLHGIEKYAKTYHLPVYYCEIKRIKRGYYQVTFELLVDDPNNLSPGSITQLYMTRCEKNILSKPGDWLWSHKRWKHVKVPAH